MSQIQVRDLVLDPAARRAWLRNSELQLTRLEFQVLLYLANRAGHLVTDAELYKAVWGTDDLIGDAALRTVIMRLRQKLGDDPRAPRYIVTVWGEGYRLDNAGGGEH